MLIYDLNTHSIVKKIDHGGAITSTTFSGMHVAAGGGKKVTAYCLKGSSLLSTFECSDSMQSIVFSPDGFHIAAGGEDKKVTVFNANNQRVLYTFERSDEIESIAFSYDGLYLAAGGDDNKVVVYDLRNQSGGLRV